MAYKYTRGVGGSAFAGNVGESALVGQWHSHTVGAGRLEAEDERCDNQHEVEGVEGRQWGGALQRVEVGWWLLRECSSIKLLIVFFFFRTTYLSDKVVNMILDILGG